MPTKGGREEEGGGGAKMREMEGTEQELDQPQRFTFKGKEEEGGGGGGQGGGG